MTGTIENVGVVDVAAGVFGRVFFVVEGQLVEQRVRLECADLCTFNCLLYQGVRLSTAVT